VPVAQHLTNTVFIDRAIIVTPVKGEIPNEQDGLVMASQFQQGSSVGNGIGRMGGSGVNGSAVSSAPVSTPYPKLDELGLPPYPILPVGTPLSKVDEMRRTITVVGIDSTVSAQACMEMFSEAGEVKYFRYCMRMGDPIKYALVNLTFNFPLIKEKYFQLTIYKICAY
jgi:arginine/serine-rich splicing factor 12